MNVHASLAPRPRVVAFVPAKGSSERIANKNLQVLDGDHLFRRKLRQLVACSAIDTVYLDTESDEIAELAADLPVKHLKRPKNLADNSCDGHALFAWECANAESADLYVQVLCTAPFVTADTVGRAIQRMIDDPEADSLVGVASARQYCWAGGEPVYGRGRIPNSVELDPTVVEAMSLYIVRRREGEEPPEQRFGKKPILFELDPTEQVDINNPADFEMAEALCAGQRATEVTRLRAMQPYLSSPVLADIAKEMGLRAVLPPAIHATSPGKMLGRARTLQLVAIPSQERDSDRWKGIYNALDSYRFVRPGCVIAVANESPEHAYFGDLNATLAIRSGAVGAVIDGVTRDSRDVSLLGLPVYARQSYCDDIKYEGTLGSMNRPIRIGNVDIRHDDMIFGDENGVVTIPERLWPEVENAAWDVLSNEARIRIMAARGRDVNEILAECGAF
ncbi:MAG: NTP transferase domain-containing protein [Novosphingobium sp.]|nr:NTP transferase domain-containing protein [Novosphingobium sp.]MCP5400829.1 NTP transferase domain-containing protein [Novosphingobium sp.]